MIPCYVAGLAVLYEVCVGKAQIALIVVCMISATAIEQNRAEYDSAKAILEKHRESAFRMDGSPAAKKALNDEWDFLASYSATFLDSHPLSMLKAALNNLDHDMDSQIVQLQAGLVLVAVRQNEEGTVFLLSNKGSTYRRVWTIAEAHAQTDVQRNLLAAWRVASSGNDCLDKKPTPAPGACGPLYAQIGALSPDKKGRARFYVDAGYEQEMGATIRMQTSVWAWDGTAAELLYIDFHYSMIDANQGTRVAGDKLIVVKKDEFKSFFACGACEGRQLEERLRVGPDGTTKLGTVSLYPDLDRIDNLRYRIAKERPTASLASNQVVERLRPIIAEPKQESAKIEKDWFSVGMLADWATHTSKGEKQVCFVADDIGRLDFTMKANPDGWFVTNVTVNSDAFDCHKH